MPQCSEGRSGTNSNNYAQSLTERYNIKRSNGKEISNINIYSCSAPRRHTSVREPALSVLSHGRPSTSSALTQPLELPASATTTPKCNWTSKNEGYNSGSRKDVNSKPLRVELFNGNQNKQHWLQSALAEELLHNEKHAQEWEISKSSNANICVNDAHMHKNFFLPRAVQPSQNLHYKNIYDRQEERLLHRENERSANEHLRQEATAELKPVHNLIGLATYLLKQTSQHRSCPASSTVCTDHHRHHQCHQCQDRSEEIQQELKQGRLVQEEKKSNQEHKIQECNYVESPIKLTDDVHKEEFPYDTTNNNVNNVNESARESKYTNTLQNIRDVYLSNTSRQSAKRRNSRSARKLTSTKNNDADVNHSCHGMTAVGVLQYNDAYKHIYCTNNEEMSSDKEKKQRNSPGNHNSTNNNTKKSNNSDGSSSNKRGKGRSRRKSSCNSSGSNNSNHTSVIADIAHAYYNACQVCERKSTPSAELECVKSNQVSESSMWEYCMQTNSNSSAKVNADGQDTSQHKVQVPEQTSSIDKMKQIKSDALQEQKEKEESKYEQHDQQQEGRENVAEEIYFDTSPLVTALQTQLTPAHDEEETKEIALKPSPPSSKPTCGAFRTYKQVEGMCVEQVKPCNVNEYVNESTKFSLQEVSEELEKIPHVMSCNNNVPVNFSVGEESTNTSNDEVDATVQSKMSISVQVESSVDTAQNDKDILTQSEPANAQQMPDSLKMSEMETNNAWYSFYRGLELALLQWQTEERELIEQEYLPTINNWRLFYELEKCEILARCAIDDAELEFTKNVVYNYECELVSLHFCFVVDTERIDLEVEETHEFEYLIASQRVEMLLLHYKVETANMYVEQEKNMYEKWISEMKAIAKLEEEERSKMELLEVKSRLHHCEHVLHDQAYQIVTLKLENERKENLLYVMLANAEQSERVIVAAHERDEYYLLFLNWCTESELEERVHFVEEQTIAFTFILFEFVHAISGQFNGTRRYLTCPTKSNIMSRTNTESINNSSNNNNKELVDSEEHTELVDKSNKKNDVAEDDLTSNAKNREEGNLAHSNQCNNLTDSQIGQEDKRITINEEDEAMEIASFVRSVSDNVESQKANSRELVDKDKIVSLHQETLLPQKQTRKELQEHDEQQMEYRKTTEVTNATIIECNENVALPFSSCCCCCYHMPIVEVELKIHLIQEEEECTSQKVHEEEQEEEMEEHAEKEEQEVLHDKLTKYDWEEEREAEDDETKLNSSVEAQVQFWKEDNEQQAQYKTAPPQFVLDHAQHSKFITAAAVSALHNFAKHTEIENDEEFADYSDDEDVEDEMEDVNDFADKIFDSNGGFEEENEINMVDDDMFISDLHDEFYDNVIENITNKNKSTCRNQSKNKNCNSKNKYHSSKKSHDDGASVNSSSDDSSSNSSLIEENQHNECEKRCNTTDPEEQNFWKELHNRIERDVDGLDAGMRDNSHGCRTHERYDNDSNIFEDDECDDVWNSESSSKEDDKSAPYKLRRVENAEELPRWNVQRRRREARRDRVPLIDSATSSKSNFSKTNSLNDLGISDT